MLQSIKAKILLAFLILMLFILVSVTMVTQSNFDFELRNIHYQLAQKTLQSSVNIIEHEYSEMSSHKINLILRQRELMKNISLMALSTINEFYSLYSSGLITEARAKELSLNWLTKYRYGDNQYFFVCDSKLTGIAHPIKEMIGKKWYHSFDIKTKDAIASMWRSTQAKKHSYTVFDWPELPNQKNVEQLGYFTLYQKWDWLIGTSYQLSDLDEKSLKKHQHVINKLKSVFQNDPFSQIGQIFVFDKHGQLIINPNNYVRKIKQYLSDKGRLNKLISSAQQENISLEHDCFSKDCDNNQFTYVNYVKAAEWYTAVSITDHIISEPVITLVFRQIYILVGILIIGVVMTFLISKKISAPIMQLADYARKLPKKNYRNDDKEIFPEQLVLQKAANEVKVLYDSFSFMEKELRHQHQNLEKIVTKRTSALQKEVNERKKAEASLMESDYRYRSIFEGSLDGIVFLDVRGRFVDCNPSFQTMLGYSLDELKTMNSYKITPKKWYRWEKEEIVDKQLLKRGYTDTYEKEFIRKDGSIFPVEITAYELEGQYGGQTLLWGVVRDIAERKKSQELLVQTEKMMSVGGLAAGMAHEINNPLAGILQCSQNILRRVSPNMNKNIEIAQKSGLTIEQIRDYLEEREILKFVDGIKESGVRASKIISNMLQFSRNSLSQKKHYDIHSIINETITLAENDYDLKKKYDFKKIHIQKDFEENLPQIHCVKNEIQQVILNLLTNSSHALTEIVKTQQPPEIYIATKKLGNFLNIDISDNGPGINKKNIKHIFEPFFTTKETGTGTGLGLSVSYFIITNNHKGLITAESEPGKGAKFMIKLPFLNGIRRS